MDRTTARWVLGGLVAAEGAAALARHRRRTLLFNEAQARARRLGRPLVVVGAPRAGAHTRLLPAYGCGDVCVDLAPCDCPVAIQADITRPMPQLASDSSVVFVSCVFEYVSDPQAGYAELLRIAGARENLFVVDVQPWTATAALYPGARWRVVGSPPAAPCLTAYPVSTARKVLYAGAVAALAWAALRPSPRAPKPSTPPPK